MAQSSTPLICLLLLLGLPVVACIVTGLIPSTRQRAGAHGATVLSALTMLAACVLAWTVWHIGPWHAQITWLTLGATEINAGVWVDRLSAIMMVVVTLVSFLVQLYSLAYMHDDDALARYYSMLAMFTGSMLLIVVSDNLLGIFVGWELVGFSSYMLIGHWRSKVSAGMAASKAFIVNRVGDAAFLVGLMLVWSEQHTFSLDVLQQSPTLWSVAAALCIFGGVVGKSAQFPLFTWLPDAMEGPTPVSALIHAATMVAAGVFLLARLSFMFATPALDVIVVVGGITALLGALAALVQTDLKKILAYSTMSQLGLMVVAFGAGSPAAAILHLFTHAFFKACLFLSAGAIIHSLHEAQHHAQTQFDAQDIRLMGGMRRSMPITFFTFAVSGAALAGLPFFSGFLSKDAILATVYHWQGDSVSWRWLLSALVLVVSFATPLYIFRLILKVFMGEARHGHALVIHEAPRIMQIPMVVLALLSLWWVVDLSPLHPEGWLFQGLSASLPDTPAWLPIGSACWVLLATALAWTSRTRTWQARVLFEAFYIDRLYQFVIVNPTQRIAQATAYIDVAWIDGALHAGAYIQVTIANLIGWFDRAIIDGMVNGMASVARMAGSFLRSFQGGKIQLYIFWSALAIIIFIIWTLL